MDYNLQIIRFRACEKRGCGNFPFAIDHHSRISIFAHTIAAGGPQQAASKEEGKRHHSEDGVKNILAWLRKGEKLCKFSVLFGSPVSFRSPTTATR